MHPQDGAMLHLISLSVRSAIRCKREESATESPSDLCPRDQMPGHGGNDDDLCVREEQATGNRRESLSNGEKKTDIAVLSLNISVVSSVFFLNVNNIFPAFDNEL